MASIEREVVLAHPVAKVWRALTEADVVGRWLMPNDLRPVVGHQFTFATDPAPGFDGIVHCEVLAVEPERLLAVSWRGGPLDTTVTWTLEPVDEGTRLRLVHAGFDLDDPGQRAAFDILGDGWGSHMPQRLAAVLAEL